MISAVIVAGGKGLRMKAAVRKQYLPLAGRPVLAHTLMAFDQCDAIDQLFLVLPADDVTFCRKSILPALRMNKKIIFVAGGTERQRSVYNGLLAVGDTGGDKENSLVLIHDAVRPFVQCRLIRACIAGARQHGACIPAVAAFDTLKQVEEGGVIRKTVPRSDIFLAQTPQVFRYQLIRQAHEQALETGLSGTDDASLVEEIGEKVAVIEGSRLNIKITNPEDLLLAEAIFHTESRT